MIYKKYQNSATRNYISRNLVFSVFLFILIAKPHYIFGQKYVKDSVTINFGEQQVLPVSMFVDTILDKRDDLKGNQLRISEKTRYLFIPVDRYFITEKPLTENIHGLFTGEKSDTSLKLIIDQFEIDDQTGLVKRTVLSAKIRVYEGDTNESKQLKGTLLYQIKRPYPKKKDIAVNYEQLINSWKQSFVKDIDKVRKDNSHSHSFNFYNYRPLLEKIPTKLYLSSYASVGFDWWMTDVEFGFYDPEANRKFMQQTSYLRYRRTRKFESLAIGKQANHFCYRLNSNWLVEAVPQICLGLTRWNDWDTNTHDLFDIFIVNGSIREDIQFQPIDKSSILFTAGLIQDVYFINSINVQFKPGVVFGLGYKF